MLPGIEILKSFELVDFKDIDAMYNLLLMSESVSWQFFLTLLSNLQVEIYYRILVGLLSLLQTKNCL